MFLFIICIDDTITMDGTDRMISCDGGVYRWTYEKSLYSDLSILFLILKIFIGISLVMGLIDLIVNRDIGMALEMTGIMILIMGTLSIIGYFVYAVMMDGAYIVEFTMDEYGLMHRQLEKQAKKARKIAGAAAIAGAAGGSRGAIAAGATVRTEMYSSFKDVGRLRLDRKHNTIHLDGNQAYVWDGQIDMVWNYIKEHCPNAHIKGQS